MDRAGNVLFIGIVLLLLLHPPAKAWVLQRFLATGLFGAEIKKDPPAVAAVPFSFCDQKGQISSTADLQGKVVFINFWATWCPPCRAEMPDLNDLYQQFRQDERFVFLFINEDNDAAKAKTYLQDKGFAMPLATLAGAAPAAVYSGTLPTTVVLNKEGKIVYRHEGIAQYNTKDFMNQLRALL